MSDIKKAMISQPMKGLTDEEVLQVKNEAVSYLNKKGYEVVNTFFEDFDESKYTNIGIAYLAKSLDELAKVDVLYCCKGWENARGCVFEHDIAKAYGVEIIEE